ncbi:MAG TPA: chemotaxis protein CheX, partial [Bryobacteraceae bacterium]|nr:chemotaxis protein CheX [Bryobacteraceae bacterium]
NFLGAEDESGIQEEQVGEVLCELANMICGSVLSRLAGDLAFDLSHPELVAGDGDRTGWLQSAARTFELENGWLTAAIRFEEP